MELFKYIKSEYVEKAIHDGVFRIGTLYDYRNEEEFGTAIGEQEEGITNLDFDACDGRELELSSNCVEAVLLRKALNLSLDDPYTKNKIRFRKGSRIEYKNGSTNGLVFCASTEFDSKVMREFGCNCCIHIKDAEMFFRELSKSIEHLAYPVRAGKLIYFNRYQNYRNLINFHPAMVKPKEYTNQKEYRVIWEFKGGLPIEPILSHSKGASNYIAIYSS